MMKTKNFPIFFIGGRYRGYLWIKEMIENKENIVGACIMQEDIHEHEKYFDKIAALLKNNKIPYLAVNSINKSDSKKFIKNKHPFLIIVMGWRTIIPKDVIAFPKYGSIAVHESLLPKYRGFAPVNWAVINGAKTTGVTLFYLDSNIDNGDIIGQKDIKIFADDTAYDVYGKTSSVSIELLKKYLPLIKKGRVKRKKQDEEKATFTCMRLPEDGAINWSDSSEKIYNLIRGLGYPYPGAFSYLNKKKMYIWKASIPKQKEYVGKIPGRVVKIEKKGVQILSGDGIILLEEVQIEGREKTSPYKLIKSIRTSLTQES